MSIDECMSKHSVRQLRLWMKWFEMDYEETDKTDLLLMQIACEVRRVLSKNPNSINIQDFKLRFRKNKSNKTNNQTSNNLSNDPKYSKTNLSKSFWLGSMSMAIDNDGKKSTAKEIISKEITTSS